MRPGDPLTSRESVFTQIRWRLVGWSMLVLGLILLVVGGTVYLTLSRSLLTQIDANLAGRGAELTSDPHDLAQGHVRFDREGYSGGTFYLVLADDGRILTNPQQIAFPPGLLLPGNFGNLPTYTTINLEGAPTRLYLRSLSSEGLPNTLLVIGQSMAIERDTLDHLLLVLLGGGAAGLFLSFAGAWFLAGRALVPIQLAFRRQQEFVADASHELRTPLAVIRAATDLLNQRRSQPLEANALLLDDLRGEIARLERLAGDLLTLARSDVEGLDLAVGEVDLAPFVGDVARRVAPLAVDRGITLSSRADDTPLLVEGDPDRLQQVLLILLDNALKHTPPGGHVVVSARRQGGEAVLQVSDDGEGIAPEHLPQVFDRFYRADRARARSQGGSGLGLAIALSLVHAHHGQLSLSSALGSGTTATIRLRLLPTAGSLADRLGHLAARVAHRGLVE
jgi:signal transduction histidine kinase